MYRVKNNDNPLYKTNVNEAITYDFYNEQDVFLAGFHGFTACQPCQRNHKMDLLVQWYDNFFYSEDKLNLNAEIYRYVRIRLKNGSKLTEGRIYFITDSDREWTKEKSVSFTMRPTDELYYTYSIPMGENPLWSGRIEQLKFCPLDYTFGGKRVYGDMGVLLSYDFIQFAAEDLNPGALAFPFKYDMEGFEAVGGEAKVWEYMMRCEASEGGFYLQSPAGLRLSAKTNRFLRIRQKTDSNAEYGVVAYTTQNDKVFDELKRLSYRLTDANAHFTEYTVDLSGIDDELWQIRVYPMGDAAGYCEIDYLIFDTVETSDVILDVAGKLCCDKADAYLEATGFTVDAAYLKYLHIRMANATLSRNAILQWITEEDPVYDERKLQRFVIRPMDDMMRDYTVGFNQNQYWRGNIIGLRMIPAADVPMPGAEVTVEKLAICRDGDTMSQHREIIEGHLEASSGAWLTGAIFNRAGGDILGYASHDCDWVGAGNLENDTAKRAGSVTIISKGNGQPVGVHKKLAKQSDGVIDWTFAFQVDEPTADGVTFRLQNGAAPSEQEVAIALETKDGYLSTADTKLVALTPFTWYEVRVMLDLDQGSYTVAVDGNMVEERFAMGVAAFDTIELFITGQTAVRTSVCNRMYKVGYLYEDYFSFPANMTFSEGVVTANKKVLVNNLETAAPVDYRLNFVREAKDIVDCEAVFLIQDQDTDAAFELMAGDTAAVSMQIKDGNLSCVDANGVQTVLWESYKPRVWYSVVMTVNTVLGTADFRINGQVRAKGVCVAKTDSGLTAFRLAAKKVDLELNQVRVKPHIYSTVPYIDRTPSRTGLVGVIAWFLLGGFWTRVHNQFEISDKTPYLGYYDDMNLDTVDWQMKYLSEHGVDFFTPFMYSSLSSPAYSADNMLTTFLRYSDHHEDMKFCITMGEIFEPMTRDKMMNNVLPFMVENYFKHPSYLLVDNKPVLMVYSWATMMKDMTPEGLHELVDEMREALKKEGFDGLIVIGEDRPNLDGTLQRDLNPYIASGADRLFAYCNVYTADAAQGYVRRTAEAGIKGVCSLGCGWDNRYWPPVGGYFIVNDTPAEFEDGMRWMAEKPRTDDPLDDLVVLDNWSEFGEGHSISPSNLYGFGYLNAIRKVFTDADEKHYDTVPEGALNALNINGTYQDLPVPENAIYSRWPMPPAYEAKRNVLHSGGYTSRDEK